MRKVTLRNKAHLQTVLNRQKALEGGWWQSLIVWNWKLGVVGYGLKLYTFLVRFLAGKEGFYLIWDLVGGILDKEVEEK